jgi:predicted acetyltransferase
MVDFYLDHIDCYNFTEEDYEYIRGKLDRNEPIPLEENESKYERYGIYEDGSLIGELFLSTEEGTRAEMQIAILDDYSRKGYASAAIRLYLNQYNHYEQVEAVIQPSNKNSRSIERILTNAGFVRDENEPLTYIFRAAGDILESE